MLTTLLFPILSIVWKVRLKEKNDMHGELWASDLSGTPTGSICLLSTIVPIELERQFEIDSYGWDEALLKNPALNIQLCKIAEQDYSFHFRKSWHLTCTIFCGDFYLSNIHVVVLN